MTQRLSPDPQLKHPGETLNVGVDFTLYGLAPGETLTGIPTLTPPAGISATSPTVNSAPFQNRAKGTCDVNKGVQFVCSGGTAGADYTIDVGCATSGGQFLVAPCQVKVRSA